MDDQILKVVSGFNNSGLLVCLAEIHLQTLHLQWLRALFSLPLTFSSLWLLQQCCYLSEASRRRVFWQDNPSDNGPVGQSSPGGKYCRYVVYCLYSNRIQDILFANNNATSGEIITGHIWYMEKVFMYSYNKLSLEWSELFYLLQETREKISPTSKAGASPTPLPTSRNVEPLWVSALQQLCPVHRASPLHLWRLNSCPRLWRPALSGRTVGTQKVEKRYVLLPGSQGDVA